MMAKIAGHVWSFDELFEAVLGSEAHSQGDPAGRGFAAAGE